MNIPSSTTILVAIGAFLLGAVSGKALPDMDEGIVASLTHPHLRSLDGEKLTSAKIIAGETRSLTREEATAHCSNLCAFGWDRLPSGRGGTALPPDFSPENSE